MKLRQSLFWDTDPKKIDLKKNARYIIERVLEFGHDDEIRWMWKTYKKPLLSDVVKKSRSLRADTRNLWTSILKI